MTVRTERDSVSGIEDLGQQFIHADNVVNVQGVRPTTFLSLDPALRAREPIAMKDVRPKMVVERRISDHHSDGLNSAPVVWIPVTSVTLTLQKTVAITATRRAARGLRGVILPGLAADATGHRNRWLPLGLMNAPLRAVLRDLRTTLQVVVGRNEPNGFSADLARMLASVFGDPGEGRFGWVPDLTTHTAHSNSQA